MHLDSLIDWSMHKSSESIHIFIKQRYLYLHYSKNKNFNNFVC